MQGRGSPLRLYGHVLADARARRAPAPRACGCMLLVQVLTFVNLHLAFNVLVLAGPEPAGHRSHLRRALRVDRQPVLAALPHRAHLHPLRAHQGGHRHPAAGGRAGAPGGVGSARLRAAAPGAEGRTARARSAALVFLCVLLGGTAARAQAEAPERGGARARSCASAWSRWPRTVTSSARTWRSASRPRSSLSQAEASQAPAPVAHRGAAGARGRGLRAGAARSWSRA